MDDQQFANAFEHLNQMVPARALSSTVVLFGARAKDRQLIPFGTGSLFAVSDKRFLVTAAHVQTEAEKQGFSLLCATTQTGKFTPFMQGTWCMNHNLDVALLEISDQNTRDLEKNTFLRLADVALDVDVSSGFFAIFAVPACWSESSLEADFEPVKAKALQFITTPYEGDTSSLADFDPLIHIALSASDEHHRNFDGSKISWPDRLGRFLPGISGCAIWKIAATFKPERSPNPDEARVVGVETSVYSSVGVIRGTRWSAVAALIRHDYPQLRTAFDLALPRWPVL